MTELKKKLLLAAFAVAMLVIAAGLGALAAEAWIFAPRLEESAGKLGKAESDLHNARIGYAQTRLALQRQNEAVAKLHQDGEAARLAALQAQQNARELSVKLSRRAQQVLVESPVLADRCEAARLAFDAELKQERGL